MSARRSQNSELHKAVREDAELRARNREAREARMVRVLREGLGTAEMSERFGCDEGVVNELRRRYGIPPPEPIHMSNRYTRLRNRKARR
jgi:hypothetical protein